MAEIFDFYVADNRTIKFNPIEPILQEDNGVAVWRFRIPKVLNNIDMSGFAWWFVYINAAKQKYSEPLTLTADADDPDNYCIADYTIDYGISLTPGSFTFALEAINANGSGEIVEEWHTKTYSHSVIGTLQGNQAEYSETESDIISALMVQIQEKYNALVGGATPIPVASISAMTDTSKIYLLTTDNNWYCYNGSTWVSGGQYASGIVIDPTLTQPGQAADAKVVGDEIDELKSALSAVKDSDEVPIIIDKLTLVQSVNLYNKDKAVTGYEIGSDGNLSSRSGVAVSNYIPVTAGNVVYFSYYTGSFVVSFNFYEVAGYDSNKNYVSGSFTNTRASSYSVPAGCSYIRFSVASGLADTAMAIVNDSTLPNSYIAYDRHYTATNDFMPDDYSDLKEEITLVTEKLVIQEPVNFLDIDHITDNSKFNNNGSVASDSGYFITNYMYAVYGDTLRFYYFRNNLPYTFNYYVAVAYDKNKNILDVNTTRAATYTVPQNAKYVRISISAGIKNSSAMAIKTANAPTAFVAYDDRYYGATEDFIRKAINSLDVRQGLVQKTQTDFWTRERSSNLFNKSDITEGEYFNGNGTTSTSASMFRSYVELDGAGSYSLQVNGGFYGLTNSLKIPCYDKDKNFVKTITATTSESSASTNNKCLLTISAQDMTDGVFYIGYSQNISYKDTEMVVKASTYPSTYTAFYERWTLPDLNIDSDNNPLKGKIAVFDGDSICAGLGSEMGDYGRGWAGRVGVDNDMIYYNVGVSGACITAETYSSGGSARHWVSRYIDTIYLEHPDADYIILEGGTNDADNFYNDDSKLGTFNETDFTGPFDDTKFYGAMDSLCMKALSYFPKAKIGFIVAQKMGLGFVTYTKNRYDFFTYAEKVCKKWGIPVLNLWDEGQLRPDVESNYNPTYNTIQTATEHGYLYYDGQHLTAYGYDVISPKIAAWMKTL